MQDRLISNVQPYFQAPVVRRTDKVKISLDDGSKMEAIPHCTPSDTKRGFLDG
jgi:hypothetical protein